MEHAGDGSARRRRQAGLIKALAHAGVQVQQHCEVVGARLATQVEPQREAEQHERERGEQEDLAEDGASEA